MAIAKIVHLSVVGGLSRDDLEGPTPGPSGVELQLDRARSFRTTAPLWEVRFPNVVNSCKLLPRSSVGTPPHITPCCVLSIANENKTQANRNVPTFCTLLTFPVVCEKFGADLCRTFQCGSGSFCCSLCCSMRLTSLRDIALRMTFAWGDV